MKTLTKKQILFVLFTMSFCVLTYAEQAEQPKRQLEFEISNDPVQLHPDPAIQYPGLTHVAQFHVIKNRDFGPWFRTIQETPQWKELSEKQRELIIRLIDERRYDEGWLPILEPFESDGTPPRAITFFIYGVSEEEAKKTAEAVIEFYNNSASEVLQSYKEGLVREQNVIAEAEKILPELKTDFEKAEASADEKKNEFLKANYGLENLNNIHYLATKNIEELSHSLRAVNFELVGLEARINSINKYKLSETIIDNETLIKLNQILITADIERAGALARKEAYEVAFNQTKEMLNAFESRDKISVKINEWKDKLNHAKIEIPQYEKILSNPPSDMRPLEVIDNKIVVKPVKQD